MNVSSTTPMYEPPTFGGNHTPNFYVNAMNTDPTSTNDEPQVRNEAPEQVNVTENVEQTPNERTPDQQQESAMNSEPINDPFQIDEADKETLERNGARAGEIEVFPESTPVNEQTPQGQWEENDYDDALNIDTDVVFDGDFE